MFTAQALIEAFIADVVEALKSEVVCVLVSSGSVNSEMGKNKAEAQHWLIHPVILPWDGHPQGHDLVGGTWGGKEHRLRCHKYSPMGDASRTGLIQGEDTAALCGTTPGKLGKGRGSLGFAGTSVLLAMERGGRRESC